MDSTTSSTCLPGQRIVCAHTRQLEVHRPQVVVPPRQHLEVLGEEGVDIPRSVTHLVGDRRRAEQLQHDHRHAPDVL
jgi:hypothetical protein